MITTFGDFLNEEKKDTTDINFNVGSLIQIKKDGKNADQAKITRMLKNSYKVKYNSKEYKVDKDKLILNKHGQIQTDIDNLY